MVSLVGAAKEVSIGGQIGFIGVLLANTGLGWWAWHSPKPIVRTKRLPAFGMLNFGCLILGAPALLKPAFKRLGIRDTVANLMAFPVLLVGFAVIVFAAVNLVKPRKCLEAGARSARIRRREM
jgi:hypothetical protein